MELLDIVDKNNSFTGQKAERSYAHANKLLHRHISCWIMNPKGEILFQKRVSTKERDPNMWAKTGGHVDSGEDIESALLREVKEEIGVDITLENSTLFDVRFVENQGFFYNYVVKVDYNLSDYTIQEEELCDLKYMTIEDMETLTEEEFKNYTFSRWTKEVFAMNIEVLKKYRAN